VAGSPVIEGLRGAGFAVAVCPGPAAGNAGGPRCPLVEHGECPLVEGADVVLWGLGLEAEESRRELRTLRARRPRLPVVVRASAAQAARWPQLLVGMRLVEPSAPAEELVEAVIEEARSSTSFPRA
jgi:hypothetical protein